MHQQHSKKNLFNSNIEPCLLVATAAVIGSVNLSVVGKKKTQSLESCLQSGALG